MKIRDLARDLSYKEIKKRRWRTPRLWKKGEKILFNDYAMSNDGTVIRITKNSGTCLGRKITIWPEKSEGYLILNLSLERKSYTRIKLHRLLWETWVGKIPEGFEMNHKDGKKGNSADLKNLEAVTHKENMQHAMKIGLNWTEEHRKVISKIHKGKKLSLEHRRIISEANKGKKFSEERKKKMSMAQRGEKSSSSKLTQKEVDRILILRYKKNWTLQRIADKFKVSKSCINHILLGYHWNPENLTKEELKEKYGN